MKYKVLINLLCLWLYTENQIRKSDDFDYDDGSLSMRRAQLSNLLRVSIPSTWTVGYCNRSVKSQKVLKIGPSHLVYFAQGKFWDIGPSGYLAPTLGLLPASEQDLKFQKALYPKPSPIYKVPAQNMCTFHLCTVDILHTFNTLLPLYLPTNVEGTRVKLVGHGIRSHVFIENSPLPVCKICTFV